MVKRTPFNNILVILSKLSPILLTILVIILWIRDEQKTFLYLVILLIIGYLFEVYEKRRVIPGVVFYLFTTLQVWLEIILDFVINLTQYIILF